MGYITYQQHEPLRVPNGWDTQEKILVSQLEQIFDDIYRRFNRLKLTDFTDEVQEEIEETVEAAAEIPDIKAAIDMDDENGVIRAYVDNVESELRSAIELVDTGIRFTVQDGEVTSLVDIDGHSITMAAETLNLVGVVKVGDYIQLDANGRLTAIDGTFSGSLTAGNWAFNASGAAYGYGGAYSTMAMLSGGTSMAGATWADNPSNYRMFYGSSSCDVQYGSDYSYNMYLRSKRIILMAGSDGYGTAIMGKFMSGEGSGTEFSFFPAVNDTGNIGSSNRRWNTIRYGTGGCSGTSSRTRKENIEPIPDCGKIIDALAPVTFDFKESKKHSAGFILEDTFPILPLVCDVEEDMENGGIYYERFIPYLVKELQTLRRRVADLEEAYGYG